MAAFAVISKMPLIGTVWSAPSTAPGLGAGVTIAGTITSPSDLSAYAYAGDVGFATNMLDTTNFGSGGFQQFIPGLSSGDDIQLMLNGDFAATQGWSMIQTVFGTLGVSRPGDVVRYLDLKATSSARSATNPSFVLAVYSKGLSPVQGAVGDKGAQALTLQVTGGFSILTA